MADVPSVPISGTAAYWARVYYGITLPLILLCLVAITIRLRRRMKGRLLSEDWLILLGVCLAVIDWGLFIPEMILSECLLPFPQVIDAVKFGYFAIHVWSWAMTSIKVSVALMLLRIRDTTRWRCFLYGIIALQVTYCVGNMIFLFNACHPIATWWDRSIPGGFCVSDSSVLIASYTGSSVSMITDVLLSLSPVVFLRKLNCPMRERVMLCVLMGLGLLAAMSSLIKVITVHIYDSNVVGQADAWTFVVAVSTWTVLEPLFSILAACGPFMKTIVERTLSLFGVCVSPQEETPSRFCGGFRETFRIVTITSSTHREPEVD